MQNPSFIIMHVLRKCYYLYLCSKLIIKDVAIYPCNGSVNSKRAHPRRAFSHLVGPSGREFVRKPLPGGGAIVNSSRSSQRRSFFNISLKNMLI